MESLLTLIEHHGLWLVFANVLLLQLGVPVPAYPTLMLMGALSAQPGGGGAAPWHIVGVAAAASLLADLTWYAAGQRHGRRVLRLMCRISLSPDSCVRQTETLYERWGAPSLAVAKFIPGFAAVATSMAGLVRTPLPSFVLFDSIGALLWASAGVGLGWVFSGAVAEVIGVFESAGRWGLVGLVSALCLYLAVRSWRRWQFMRVLRMSRVTVDELHGLLASGERPLVIDVRTPASRNEGHIPGSVWVDAQAFDPALQAQGQALLAEHGDEVIVYCACPNEASAAVVARKLMRAGFRRVRPLGGGIDAWRDKGYAVETAAPPPLQDTPVTPFKPG